MFPSLSSCLFKESLLHNIYSFNASVTSNLDRRKRQTVKVETDAACLHLAWDKAERKVKGMYPDHEISLSMGNRQPVALRPSCKETKAA